MDKLRVAVLGATGLVGQRFIQILHDHPFFQLDVITASEKSAYRKYGEVVKWLIEYELPRDVAEMELLPMDIDKLPKVDLVFSALPSDVASKVEPELAKRGFIIISNSSNLRLEPDIPLIVPEVNLEHLKLIEVQRRRRDWRGLIIKNPNCTTIILTLSLKPLLDNFGIKRIFVTTMQAISGAGIGSDAVLGMQITDNIIPYIKGEEEKVENESKKILGTLSNGEVRWRDFEIIATTNRVPVLDGHLESVYVELEREVTLNDIINVFRDYTSSISKLNLPTAPEKPIIYRGEIDRPQPRLDRMCGKGMSVVVGRVKLPSEKSRIVRYLVLGHNTIRGAAGNTVLIGEVMYRMFPEILTL